MTRNLIMRLAAIALLLVIVASPALAKDTARPYWWDRLQTMAKRDGYQLLRPNELKSLYAQGGPLVIIDARTSYEFKAGHLPGARSVEFNLSHSRRLDPATKEQLLKALGPDPKARAVIYDRGLQCVRGQLAAQWAVSLGHSNVWLLAEGWMGWLALAPQESAQPNRARLDGAGRPFAEKSFVLLGGAQDRAYLGLPPGTKSFRLASLPAEYALVELYNELCLTCCQSVPALNKLSLLIKQEPALAKKVVLVGIGVGSLGREVHRFRRENQVGFPLFADKGGKLHKSLGSPALPLVYLIRLKETGGPRIISVEQGPFARAESLMGRIKEELGKSK